MEELPAPDPFDSRRRRIYEAIFERSPELAGYYWSAIETLASEPAVGRERQRISTLCHSVRELMNGLPDLLGNKTARINDNELKDSLKRLPDQRLRIGDNDEVVPIARDVAIELDNILRLAAIVNSGVQAKMAALLTGTARARHPLARQWNSTLNYFVKWAHWDHPTDETRPLPTNAEIEARLKVVEDVLEARIGEFLDVAHDLDDILAEANATVEEDEK